MPKKSGKLHQINEHILVKVTMPLSVNLTELDETPDFQSLKSIKEKILKQLSACLEEDEALQPVAFSLEILETHSRSITTCEDKVRDED